MKDTALYKLCAMGLVALLTGILVSCGEKGPKVEDVTVRDVQIIHFRISVKNNPQIGQAFFSIDNAQGQIYNAIPLPYGTQVDSVLPAMRMFKANKVRIAVGSGEFKDWKATDSVSLKNSDGTMRIQVTSSDGEATKQYKVRVSAYSFDPDTYIWEPVAGCNLPETQATRQWTLRLAGSNALILLRDTEADKAYIGGDAQGKNFSQWRFVTMTGLKGKIEAICQMAQAPFDRHVFAQTNMAGQKHLYQATISTDGWKWQELNIPAEYKDFQLLGAVRNLGVANTQKDLMIYLSAAQTNGAGNKSKVFVTLNTGSTMAQAADFAAHETVPSDFPERFYTSISSNEFNKDVVRIIGGASGSDMPKSTNWNDKGAQLWYTTNGNDWFRPTPAIVGDVPISNERAGVLATSAQQYLFFGQIAKTDGTRPIAVFVSKDKGASWRLGNATLILPPADKFGDQIDFAFADENGNIYLGSSVSSKIPGGAILWRGHLKLQD